MLFAHGPDLCEELTMKHAMANCFEALMGKIASFRFIVFGICLPSFHEGIIKVSTGKGWLIICSNFHCSQITFGCSKNLLG